MDKLFKFERGFLTDESRRKIRVDGLRDMSEKIKACLHYVHNVRIAKGTHMPNESHAEWGPYAYLVLADYTGYSGECIGMCNFYESEDGRTDTPDARE